MNDNFSESGLPDGMSGYGHCDPAVEKKVNDFIKVGEMLSKETKSKLEQAVLDEPVGTTNVSYAKDPYLWYDNPASKIKASNLECPISAANKNILKEAYGVVFDGNRKTDYGGPKESFSMISKIASLLGDKELTPVDCVNVLIAVKLAREKFSHKRDNLVDLVGYTAIKEELYNNQ